MREYGSFPLKEEQLEQLQVIGSLLGKGESMTLIENNWEVFLQSIKNYPDQMAELSANIPASVSDLVMAVLQEAYTEQANQLEHYSEKVRLFNDQKKQIREHINQYRTASNEYIESLESKLSTVEADAQLANVDMQYLIQKQQQTSRMLPQLSNTLHDTAMAVIRKIG